MSEIRAYGWVDDTNMLGICSFVDEGADTMNEVIESQMALISFIQDLHDISLMPGFLQHPAGAYFDRNPFLVSGRVISDANDVVEQALLSCPLRTRLSRIGPSRACPKFAIVHFLRYHQCARGT